MVTFVVMLGLLASLFSGCFLKKKLVDDQITDGPGMVNYNGLLLNALIGDWADEDQNYRLMIGNNSTISIYYGSTPLLENAALNLYATSEDTNEYNELSINPNTWTDELGKEAQITNAYHEDGTITLELAFDDGTEADIAFHWFYREPELLDGPGMVYEGGPLDEALTGCWYGADGRFVLDFEGKCADFLVDGKMQMCIRDRSEVGGRTWSRGPVLTETRAEGGAGKALGRMFMGENLFMNTYTAQGPAEIAFSSSFPGKIVARELAPGQSIVCQKRAFLCGTYGIELAVHFQKKLGAGLAGGEGFIMQRITGPGLVFLEVDGYCQEYDLQPGEQLICDTGVLAIMDATCMMDVQLVKGAKNMPVSYTHLVR